MLSDDIVERIVVQSGVGLPRVRNYRVETGGPAPMTIGIFRGVCDKYGDLWVLGDGDWRVTREHSTEWTDKKYYSISDKEWHTVFVDASLYLPIWEPMSETDDTENEDEDLENRTYCLGEIGEVVEKDYWSPVRLVSNRFRNCGGAPMHFKYLFHNGVRVDDDVYTHVILDSDSE